MNTHPQNDPWLLLTFALFRIISGLLSRNLECFVEYLKTYVDANCGSLATKP